MSQSAGNHARLVAHVLPYPSIGGTEQATLRVMKAVEPYGYSGVAVFLQDTGDMRRFFGEGGRDMLGWPAPEPSVRHARTFLAACRALAAEFKRLGVELVHCSDYLAAWHASLAGRLAGVPVICHIRNRHDFLSRRDQLFLRPVAHFAFVSRDTWTHFAYRVPERRGTVLYDGIDPPPARSPGDLAEDRRALKAELGLPDSVELIGMLARVTPQKDYDTLAAAAARVIPSRPNVRFVVAGDCSSTEVSRAHYAHVQQVLQKAGLSDYFVFTGFRTDIQRLLAAFDISVLSTHQEGLPLALLEAMVQSQPVVATAVDGIPELIVDGQNGFLTAHGDAEGLGAKLIELIDSPALRTRLGDAARQTVLENFTAQQFARSLVTLYSRFTPPPATP